TRDPAIEGPLRYRYRRASRDANPSRDRESHAWHPYSAVLPLPCGSGTPRHFRCARFRDVRAPCPAPSSFVRPHHVIRATTHGAPVPVLERAGGKDGGDCFVSLRSVSAARRVFFPVWIRAVWSASRQ